MATTTEQTNKIECELVYWEQGRYKGYWLAVRNQYGNYDPFRKVKKPTIDIPFAQSFVDPFIVHKPCWI